MGKQKVQSTVEAKAESSKKFQLKCLCEKNSNSLRKSLRTFLASKSRAQGRSQVEIGNSGPLAKDFTPWWDELRNSSSQEKLSSSKSTTATLDSDSYNSWFSKSSAQGSNWLSGPQRVTRSATSQAQKSQIEDIAVPSIYEEKISSKGRRALKRERKAEREKTLGKKWFDMKAPDKDDPARRDMELIQMRGVLDPKRFYKNQDRKAVPKYFQMGTVVDEGTEFYASRLTKKQRKQTLVEELMADANVRQYNKRKYAELQQKMRGKKKVKGKSH